jgi:hypothetical protein
MRYTVSREPAGYCFRSHIPSTWCHALIGKLFDRLLVLGQMLKPHAAQYVWRLSELDVVVGNDLYAIAPWVFKIEKRTGQWFDIHIGQRLVTDHKPKMSAEIAGCLRPFCKGKELIA